MMIFLFCCLVITLTMLIITMAVLHKLTEIHKKLRADHDELILKYHNAIDVKDIDIFKLLDKVKEELDKAHRKRGIKL